MDHHPLSPLCAYCGAAVGARTAYRRAAADLGREMALRGIGLVYGGGKVGLMGEIAASVLAGGGTVTGIITRELMSRELGHEGITDLRIVDSMHERKKAMADIARAFVALPGGIGTLDEFFEILTWAQLGIHDRPVGMLNVEGYFDDVLRWLDHAEREGFMRINPRQALVVETDPARLLDALAARAATGTGIERRPWGREREPGGGSTGGV